MNTEEIKKSIEDARKHIERAQEQLKAIEGDDLLINQPWWLIAGNGGISRNVYRGVAKKIWENYKSVGNAFTSKEDAERELLLRKVNVKLKKAAGGFKPNWRNTNEGKYFVCCGSNTQDYCGLYVNYTLSLYQNSQVYFASHKKASDALLALTPEEQAVLAPKGE